MFGKRRIKESHTIRAFFARLASLVEEDGGRRGYVVPHEAVLTDIESVRGVALRGQREAIVVFVRLQMPDAALKSGPHRKSLQTGRVSGPADEERLTERNPREQALQLKPEFSSYTYVTRGTGAIAAA